MISRSDSHPALSAPDGGAPSTSDTLLLIGRILLGFIFLRSGYGKMFDIGAVAAGFASRGMPTFLAYIAVPAEFFGGLALILGFATRYCAVVLFVFTAVATFTSRRYWDFADAARAGRQFLQEPLHPGRLRAAVRERRRPFRRRRLVAVEVLTAHL